MYRANLIFIGSTPLFYSSTIRNGVPPSQKKSLRTIYPNQGSHKSSLSWPQLSQFQELLFMKTCISIYESRHNYSAGNGFQKVTHDSSSRPLDLQLPYCRTSLAQQMFLQQGGCKQCFLDQHFQAYRPSNPVSLAAADVFCQHVYLRTNSLLALLTSMCMFV